MTENEGAKPAGAKATNDEAAYKNALLERFREAPPATPVPKDTGVLSEKAVDYIYRAIDRQINKARGVLAYNGLLFASFGLIARNSKDTVILTLACLAKLVSVSKRLFQQQNLDLQRKFKLSFCRHSSQFI
jgi:long-subunit acyl-CoA synthetase (AMP-forming)